MSALLRSGDIKNYTALGQDGQAVYTVAAQLREAIRFKRGRMFAEYLAVPQRNDSGSTIDWYVPFESENPDGTYFIIPWSAATDEEKEKALAELDVFKANMLDLGKELARSDSLKGDQLLFSRLLYTEKTAETEQLKALRFPNQEHIYLVNDRPVITFWGFLEKNQTPYGDPFLCLRPQESKPILPSEPILPPPVMAEEKPNACKRWWWLWLLLLLLVAGLLFYALKPYIFPENKTDSVQTELSVSDNQVIKRACKDPVTYYKVDGVLRDKNGKIKLLARSCDVIVEDKAKFPYRKEGDKWISTLDGNIISDATILRNLNETVDGKALAEIESLQKAAQAGDQSAVKKLDDLANSAADLNALTGNDPLNTQKDTQQAQLPPLDPLTAQAGEQNPNAVNNNDMRQDAESKAKNLTLDPQALAQGKTDFLGGQWSAGAGIQDKATGKPLKLSYNFDKNGQGKVTLQRGDGVSCSGNVNAAANSGGVSINNAGTAACSDGSTYQLPSVVCKPSHSGEADCSGNYGGQSFPMSMKTE